MELVQLIQIRMNKEQPSVKLKDIYSSISSWYFIFWIKIKDRSVHFISGILLLDKCDILQRLAQV